MKNKKLLFGVGVNDADYLVVRRMSNGKKSVCPYFQTWRNMLERCYAKDKHLSNPSYTGCTVTGEWLSFMNFKAWMAKEDWKGNQLDKDLLIPGNKLYSPDTCVFVSGALNTFTTERTAARGEWPLGVNWRKDVGKFRVQCSNQVTGKREYLGLFDDPQEAHSAWKKRKHEIACLLADKQKDERLANALRNRYIIHSKSSGSSPEKLALAPV